ncbi:hypothetical protein BGZ59_000272, partial [Podila verticillata]
MDPRRRLPQPRPLRPDPPSRRHFRLGPDRRRRHRTRNLPAHAHPPHRQLVGPVPADCV